MTHTIILSAVFVYFLIGGILAAIVGMTEICFSGHISWVPFGLFFAWPVMFAIQIPGVALFVPAVLIAGLITWLVGLWL